MSWIKKRGQSDTPNSSSAPPVQMYNLNQHSSMQSQWQNFQPPTNSWYSQNRNDPNTFAQSSYSGSQQLAQYWQQYGQSKEQQQQQQQQQQLSHNYNQYVQPANASYQHTNYHKPPNSQYNYESYNQQIQNSNQLQQQQPSELDSWSSWGWGEDNNSTAQANNLQSSSTTSGQEIQSNLAENFANDETWNWSIEDSSTNTSFQGQAVQNNAAISEFETQNIQGNEHSSDELFPKVGQAAAKHNQHIKPLTSEKEEDNQNPHFMQMISSNEKTDNNKSTVKKLNKSETLPAQWSTESQVSQDSSENLQTSESNSRMLSRSSTTSDSSFHVQDITNVNSENIHSNDTEAHSQKVEGTIKSNSSRNYNFGNRVLQTEEQSQHENVEIVSNAKNENPESKPSKNYSTPPPPKGQTNPTPPPPRKNQTPPLMPSQSSLDDNKNPYKRITTLSHRAANKFKMENQPQIQSHFPPSTPFQQSVNLETVPDNSEHPDSYPLQSTQLVQKVTMNKPPLPHCLENNEVAPINDRNQYLETGQLSNNEVMPDNNDTLPPPGLQRMVLGQMEYNELDVRQGQSDNQIEEPPPGLSRTVIGQNVNTETKSRSSNDIIEPPVGFHRMVPGESSSPENNKWSKGTTKRSNIRRQAVPFQEPIEDTYSSDMVPNQPSQIRSATIGADTPPIPSVVASDTQNTSKGKSDESADDQRNIDSEASSSKIQEVNSSGESGRRTTSADGAAGANKIAKIPSEGVRRESIEGQPEDEVANIINTVRDLTVGENVRDTSASKNVSERSQRKASIHESTDSDSRHEEIPQKNRDHHDRDRGKDRRYRDDIGYERGKDKSKRYTPSPDRYRDKKYDRRKYRDRRYEEDTDYYSDKEKDRKHEQRDKYDEYRKYSSLRKDKYREKQRRDPAREGKRSDYYYGRYEDEYDDVSRSRPSSRSDSMHESYRDRGHVRERQRDRDRHRRHRDHRDPYLQMPGYAYDPYSPYYQQLQYQYYENLRRTNPHAYAELYRKYYQHSGSQQVYGEEERASVHSGRSSANDDLTKDRYTRQSFYSQSSYPHMGDYYREAHSISGRYGHSETRVYDRAESSLNLEEAATASQRLTPAKFSTAHVKACISSGHFIKILPHYPLDGQPATVEIGGFSDYLQNDNEYKELSEFPGPLVRGVTHKKTIIEYCESKIRNAILNEDINDTDSYILMWELMILLLRLNGRIVGTDIAELLMKDSASNASRRQSVTSNSSSLAIERTESLNNLGSESNSTPTLKEEVITNKFREYLLYGSGKEALEWAMKHGLWGHALFLASKLDKRTYANVMTRFANGLPMNDPLQTLYQLLSGKVPAATTCVADEKWGDWRPHLAMILSNTTQRPDLDRKAITTLADTLLNRGNLYAAQFCYLMAQIEFSQYGAEGAKIVLLGANHMKPFMQFASNEAIHLTEIYEYACSLNDPAFVIPEFQVYKFLIATRLSDRGLLEKGLAYLERVANTILQNPSEYSPSLISNVCKLADHLKYCEPVVVDDTDAEVVDYTISRADNTWLKHLKNFQSNYSLTQPNVPYMTEPMTYDATQANQQIYDPQFISSQTNWQQEYVKQSQLHSNSGFESWQSGLQSEQSQSLQQQQQHQQQQQEQPKSAEEGYGVNQYPEHQFWQNQQQWQEVTQQPNSLNENQNEPEQPQNNVWNNNAQLEPEEAKKEQDKDVPQPQISMPNQTKGRSVFNEQDDTLDRKPPVLAKTKPVTPKQDKPATTGWFGGIWNKLSLKPKNQMKLPDDKNPTIVWDETKKRWVNLEEDGDNGSNEIKPPPKMADLMPNKPAPTPTPPTFNQPSLEYQNANQSMRINNYNATNNNIQEETLTAKPPQPNMFKLQRARNIKNSYVDVFNPGGKTTSASHASTNAFEAPSYNTSQMNFFVPAPVNDPNAPTDFLTPVPIQQQPAAEQAQ